MSLYKIKNPVEYSFLQWMNNFPDSGHWADMERFYCFVKTVCSHNARTWKKTDYLRKKIMEANPNFNQDSLDYLLELYINLLDFYKTKSCSSHRQMSERKIKEGCYIEIRVKNGIINEVEKPIHLHNKPNHDGKR